MTNTVFYSEKDIMPARLIMFDMKGRLATWNIGEHCIIGRKFEGSKATVQVESSLVSRMHGEIKKIDGQYFYKDLGSLNGTYINGTYLGKDNGTENTPITLKNGDLFRIDYANKNEHHADAVVIVFTTDYTADVIWECQELDSQIGEINIGRGNSNIHVDNKLVSRNHASFFCARRGWAVVDHNSTNGVFLNGVKIDSPQYIFGLDVIRIANLYFLFDGKRLWFPVDKNANSDKSAQQKKLSAGNGESLVIRIAERTVWQNFKKLTLLQDINLTVDAGEMVLILGSSGAGKTTFMNAVIGYEKADGSIKHGDKDIYRDYEKVKYEIGFVPQQDLLRSSDVVHGILQNAAKIKMPRNCGNEQREARIDEVLDLLGLVEKKHTMVSKLSGGERKRLSIAVEYIANPSLFFLDEPDSGLDGEGAKNLMSNLRTIADSGKIVMVISHSPDRVAELFDKVIVLAKSEKDNCGHLAFYGGIREAEKFFETDSLEKIVSRINKADKKGEGKADFYIEKYKREYME